jgi:hypothetical protein
MITFKNEVRENWKRRWGWPIARHGMVSEFLSGKQALQQEAEQAGVMT